MNSTKPFVYGSVCSGIEAASIAWHKFGWECSFLSEIDPFARAVLETRFPTFPLHSNFTTIKDGKYRPIDLLVGGTPCFAAGTLIVLQRGLLPIEEVRVGDYALTHEGRYRQIIATGSKSAATVIVRGQGCNVTTTENHRFYAQKIKRWHTHTAKHKEYGQSEWIEAKDTVGTYVATPSKFPKSLAPLIEFIGREKECPQFNERLAYIIGVWLGDGWTRIMDRGRGSMIICAAKGKQSADLHDRLLAIFDNVTFTRERTTDRFTIYSMPLVRWIREHFKSGAYQKTIPTWLFGCSQEIRQAFFDGYLFADGCVTRNGWRCTTISPGIALGISMLAHSLGLSTSCVNVSASPRKIIEGRVVNQRPWFAVSIYDRARSSYENGIHRFGLVRSVESTESVETVYDLTVEQDHSYVANGSVVHNCQSFSVAGLRRGFNDDRGNLALQFVRLLDELRPEWFVWENVPGVLSSNKGRDFGSFLGAVVNVGYGFAYRVLDAQFYGVPQRRRRVFVVGNRRSAQRAAAVLFERESLSRYTSSRRKKREDFAGISSSSANGSSEQRLISYSPGSFGTYSEGIKALRAGNTPAGKDPLVVFPGQQITSPYNRSNPKFGDPCFTIISESGPQSLLAFQARGSDLDSPAIANPLGAHSGGGRRNDLDHETYIPGVFGTLMSSGAGMDRPAGIGSETDFLVAFSCKSDATDLADKSPTLRSMNFDKSHLNDGGQVAITSIAKHFVRRLMPLECERLQGLPDEHTLVMFKNKLAADSHRFRAIGNTFAVPVVEWIGEGIEIVRTLYP